MNLFVYGTLKHKEIFKELTGHDSASKSAILSGYKQISELKIIEADNSDYVLGLLIDNVTEKDLEAIDHYESLNMLYLRKKVQIKTDNGQNIYSWVYIPITP